MSRINRMALVAALVALIVVVAAVATEYNFRHTLPDTASQTPTAPSQETSPALTPITVVSDQSAVLIAMPDASIENAGPVPPIFIEEKFIPARRDEPEGYVIRYTGHLMFEGESFRQLRADERGYLGIKIKTQVFRRVAYSAVEAWRAIGQALVGRDLFVIVAEDAPVGEFEVEILDPGMPSELDPELSRLCEAYVRQHRWAYGVSVIRPNMNAVVCMNPAMGNNAGGIAHELGHVLGLGDLNSLTYDETGVTLTPCKEDWGANSIMAYNYSSPWRNYWPPDLKPTKEDILGPWACDRSVPGGLEAIYHYTDSNGMGNLPPPPSEPPAVIYRNIYIVAPGDTLSSIAGRFGIYTWQKLWECNRDRISNPGLIYVGQTILICAEGTPPAPPPPPEPPPPPAQGETYYVVESGDTLSRIAARFGISWQQLWQCNSPPIANPNLIYVGQTLNVCR